MANLNHASGAKSKSWTATQSASRSARPSDKLNPRTVNPFSGGDKKKTAFAAVYENGGIPCRLVHGSVKHKLAWETAPEYVMFDPVLCTLGEGLKETIHPYAFVARTGFKELLESERSGEKAVPLLPSVTASIRAALSHHDSTVFEAGLEALMQLSEAVGQDLNPFLKNMLTPVAKKISDKKFRDKVNDALQKIEQSGGKDALLLIKSKVPTYSSVYM